MSAKLNLELIKKAQKKIEGTKNKVTKIHQKSLIAYLVNDIFNPYVSKFE